MGCSVLFTLFSTLINYVGYAVYSNYFATNFVSMYLGQLDSVAQNITVFYLENLLT